MRRIVMALALLLSLVGGVAGADQAVDLELVLLADASRSIDDGEIRFQRRGYAAAITDPHVLRAIANGFLRRIAVTYLEWGDVDSQEIVVPWTIIDGPESAAAFAAKLLDEPRRAFGPNAIGNGLAILCRVCSGRPVSYDLEAAFADLIVGGPGSFVVTADGDKSFAAAVRRKLVLEIAEGRQAYALNR